MNDDNCSLRSPLSTKLGHISKKTFCSTQLYYYCSFIYARILKFLFFKNQETNNQEATTFLKWFKIAGNCILQWSWIFTDKVKENNQISNFVKPILISCTPRNKTQRETFWDQKSTTNYVTLYQDLVQLELIKRKNKHIYLPTVQYGICTLNNLDIKCEIFS